MAAANCAKKMRSKGTKVEDKCAASVGMQVDMTA